VNDADREIWKLKRQALRYVVILSFLGAGSISLGFMHLMGPWGLTFGLPLSFVWGTFCAMWFRWMLR
jgi:uncharacterized membrane protein YjjP (DUF1212 family)